MAKHYKTPIITLSFLVLSACGPSIATGESQTVNNALNANYIKSRKAVSGKFNSTEYIELKKRLETELKSEIPEGKSVLINFDQKAPNCLSYKLDADTKKNITANRIKISSGICASNNAIGFFVYTSDSYFKDIYEKQAGFILDSGFFYNEVFTEHQNCSAFLIVKPTGEFYKYYGEDYYTEAEKFLKATKQP